jgi:CHAT domain-containing protein
VTAEFKVQILPGGVNTNVRFTLSASDPNLALNGLEILRTNFALKPSDIQDLRGGMPTEPLVMRIADEVSNWIMGQDMPGYLHAPLHGNVPVRIIFSIDRSLLDSYVDLPFELLRYQNNWLVMQEKVSAIVHQLESRSSKTPNQSVPLKVLVVRTSPSGLPVKVPPAGPICNQIIRLAQDHVGRNLIQLDLLSREVRSLEPDMTWEQFEAAHLPDLKPKPGESAEEEHRKENLRWREYRQYLLDKKVTELSPGTWTFFKERLLNNDYHILVYLGHGNHLDIDNSKRKTGVLQFEEDEGKRIEPVASMQFNEVLQNKNVPVPVVLLAGCLTAAEYDALPQEEKESLRQRRLQWSVGSQGVAQGLIDSASGVQCAVGMRYQIETNDAFHFLNAFFLSLLDHNPGNVEAAVRAGRSALFADRVFPPSWSAPVIFRAKSEEPMFRFLQDIPKAYKLKREDLKNQDLRESAWSSLLEDPDSQLAPQVLKLIEENIRSTAQDKDKGVPVVMPEMKKAAPGETVTVPISLAGELPVESMKCTVAVSGEGASIVSIEGTQAFKDKNFQLSDVTGEGTHEISFIIKHSAAENALPEGEILEARVTVGAGVPAKYTVNMNVLGIQPKQIVHPVNNVVLVLP